MSTKNKEVWIECISKAIEELNEKQFVLVTRGDLLEDNAPELYAKAIQELNEVKWYLQQVGEAREAYRYLSLEVFMKHESFFMDLFESNEFPNLFELFELE